MRILTSPAHAEAVPHSRWLAWAQDAAIFACCANLFSTALGNLGFALFLLLFVKVCLGPERRSLAWSTFPRGVALAIAVYLGWEAIGMLYTEAPLSYAWESFYADRKVLYILPLALLFGAEAPRRRFLAAFLAVTTVALLISYGLTLPNAQRVLPRLPPNVLHSHATQGMVFAMSCFLALWYARQFPRWRSFFIVLSLAFLVNIVTVTVGRSGYVAFLVFVVAAFGIWRGARWVAAGVGAAALLALVFFYGSSTVQSRMMQGVNEASNYLALTEENSLGRRMLLYHTTLELIGEHPLLGGGTGSFRDRFSTKVAQRYTGWKATPDHDPHNQYLFAWVENGLPGLAAFLFLLFSLYRACEKREPYGQLAAACLLAWCATSLFSGHFRTFPEGHLIAFVLGILMTRVQPGSGSQLAGRTP